MEELHSFTQKWMEKTGSRLLVFGSFTKAFWTVPISEYPGEANNPILEYNLQRK